MKHRRFADFLWLLAGPLVWFAHFTILYGAEALICMSPQSTGRLMAWIGSVATLVALATLALVAALLRTRLAPNQDTRLSFLQSAALLTALLSALGVIWTAFPVAILPVCVPAM